jgi:hypothetical protein
LEHLEHFFARKASRSPAAEKLPVGAIPRVGGKLSSREFRRKSRSGFPHDQTPAVASRNREYDANEPRSAQARRAMNPRERGGSAPSKQS